MSFVWVGNVNVIMVEFFVGFGDFDIICEMWNVMDDEMWVVFLVVLFFILGNFNGILICDCVMVNYINICDEIV